jgi:hypothetical protein
MVVLGMAIDEDRTARIWVVTWAALTRGDTEAPAKHNNKAGGRGSTGTVA